MKTAKSILGLRKYRRYYKNGMLTYQDKAGIAKYLDVSELEFHMRLNYAHNVASFECSKCTFEAGQDCYYNKSYETYMSMTLAEIEADAMMRHLRGERWLDEWRNI